MNLHTVESQQHRAKTGMVLVNERDAVQSMSSHSAGLIDYTSAKINITGRKNKLPTKKTAGTSPQPPDKEQSNPVAFQKNLLHSVPAIIFTVDTDGIIQTFNPEAEKELGYGSAELVGRHTPEIYVDPELLQKRSGGASLKVQMDVPAGMELFPDTTLQMILLEEDEWIYVRKDGTRFPVQLKVSPLKDEAGIIFGFISVAINITKIKKIEHELYRAYEKEKELNDLKSKFVSMASHEFRTPLSTVLSSSYLIEKYTGTEDQPKREKHLKRIVSSVNMLTDILNDFLSEGKIEEGKVMVRPVMFKIDEFMKEMTEEIQDTMKRSQRILYTHEGNPDLFLDSSLLKHIIMNLVSNAGKFSSEDSLIEIKTINHKDSLVLSVKDQGIGISQEDQVHLMERFYRGTNAGNIQGTGLGLHIVSKYAELMNGAVTCKSKLGKGTEFVITFNTEKGLYEKDIADRR